MIGAHGRVPVFGWTISATAIATLWARVRGLLLELCRCRTGRRARAVEVVGVLLTGLNRTWEQIRVAAGIPLF